VTTLSSADRTFLKLNGQRDGRGISNEIQFWESHKFTKIRVAGKLCRYGKLPVQRLMILGMPVLDNQPIGYPILPEDH